MLYRNLSQSVKTFYGVKFYPGDTKDVPGYIHHPKFIRVSKYVTPISDRETRVVSTRTKSMTMKKEESSDGSNKD